MQLTTADELRETVGAVVARWTAAIRGLLPEAEVIHTGGTSLPNTLTRGDVDFHVRVASEDFAQSCAVLEQSFEAYSRAMWTPEFAAFTVPEERRLPTGLVLTAAGGEHDLRFTRGWELLRSRPELLAEYNALKRRFEGTADDAGYRTAKTAFFTRLETGA